MRCGLIGEKLGHSYSPQIHALLASYPYDLIELKPHELETFLRREAYTGLNVTIPYKKAIIPFLDELSPRAKQLGAVNTVVRQKDGRLLGHNTDYFGFDMLLRRSGLNPRGKKALVLGSGGASATAAAVLESHGASVVVISRSGSENYQNLDRHSDAALIVNATPVGMYPKNGDSPLSLDPFPRLEGVLDCIYNPARTRLLLDAEARGLVCQNGLWMLVAQAWESAQCFLGKPLEASRIPEIHRILRMQMENFVLIGMPGCGKTTIGKLLAAKTGRQYLDSDDLVAEKAGMPVPELLRRHGEAAMRALETQVLQELGKSSGAVLSTGGGCVTRPENYAPLHQNGRLFWLQRDLDALPTEGRPLSQSGTLRQLYASRAAQYERFADLCVDNNGTPEETVARILRALEEMP